MFLLSKSCPKLHRFYGAGDLHLLTFSCYRRQPLNFGDTCSSTFWSDCAGRYRLVILVIQAYVVMPEHVHVLLSEPQGVTLSTALQALKLGFLLSLASVPRSRKSGETWGTQQRP